MVRWEDYYSDPVDLEALDRDTDPQARYSILDAPLSDVRTMKILEKDFSEWVFRNALATVRVNPALKLYAGPDVSPAEFRTRCAEAAREGRDSEIKKVSGAYEKKLDTLQTRLEREQRSLNENEDELSQRRMEELGTHAENIFSMLGGKRSRRLTTSLTKRRMTAETKSDVESGRKAIAALEKEIKELEAERDQALAQIQERWGKLAAEFTETTVAPLKKDVLLELFGLAWMPFHVVKAGADTIELPGFKAELTARK
jgi:polyhydroxyalkanoate synthesis regulator phasin